MDSEQTRGKTDIMADLCCAQYGAVHGTLLTCVFEHTNIILVGNYNDTDALYINDVDAAWCKNYYYQVVWDFIP